MRYLVIRLTKLNSKHLTCIAAAHITSWTGWRITKNWRQRWVTEMELQFAVPSSAEVNEKVNVPTSTHHAARLLLMARHCTCSSWFSEKRAFHKQRVSESEWRESWKRPSFWRRDEQSLYHYSQKFVLRILKTSNEREPSILLTSLLQCFIIHRDNQLESPFCNSNFFPVFCCS